MPARNRHELVGGLAFALLQQQNIFTFYQSMILRYLMYHQHSIGVKYYVTMFNFKI